MPWGKLCSGIAEFWCKHNHSTIGCASAKSCVQFCAFEPCSPWIAGKRAEMEQRHHAVVSGALLSNGITHRACEVFVRVDTLHEGPSLSKE
jgi:hypothetical protein